METERQLQYSLGYKVIIPKIQSLIILHFYHIREDRLIN